MLLKLRIAFSTTEQQKTLLIDILKNADNDNDVLSHSICSILNGILPESIDNTVRDQLNNYMQQNKQQLKQMRQQPQDQQMQQKKMQRKMQQ